VRTIRNIFVHRRPRRGYTLIELVMVIGILGIASALLIPNMVNRQTFAIQAAVRSVIADLTFAQSDALARQVMRRVHFYEDGSGYCIIEVDTGSFDEDFDPATADFVNHPLAKEGAYQPYIVDFMATDDFQGLTISDVAIDGENTFITYDELGGTIQSGSAPGSGGYIDLTNADGQTYRVTIAPFTGKLTVALQEAGE